MKLLWAVLIAYALGISPNLAFFVWLVWDMHGIFTAKPLFPCTA